MQAGGGSLARGNPELWEEQVPTPRRRDAHRSNTNSPPLRKERALFGPLSDLWDPRPRPSPAAVREAEAPPSSTRLLLLHVWAEVSRCTSSSDSGDSGKEGKVKWCRSLTPNIWECVKLEEACALWWIVFLIQQQQFKGSTLLWIQQILICICYSFISNLWLMLLRISFHC